MYNIKKKFKYSAIILIYALIFLILVRVFNPLGIKASGVSAESRHINLIIDPGHGGEDGGAVSRTGVKESQINLKISLRLDQIMGLLGVPGLLTRDSEEIDYPADADTTHARKVADQKARLELINGTENAVLISIHQNNYTDGRPFGAEALYAPTDGSQSFAENTQKILIETLNRENYRKASKISDNIFLMNNISCPAILVECGFLSNSNEAALLQTPGYQLKAAAAIASGYFTTEKILEQICFGGTNESKDDILLHGVRK